MRWLPAVLVAGVLACAFPSFAAAKDYCVDTTPACGTQNVGSFQEALTDSAGTADADRIFLGMGTHTAAPGNGFTYDNPARRVEIIGASAGASILTAQPGASGDILRLMAASGTSIHDLRILLPPNANGLTGLETNARVHDISVGEELPQPNYRKGVTLMGGVFEDATMALGQTGTSTGVVFDDGGGTVRHAVVFAGTAILSTGGGLIERSQLLGWMDGLTAYRKQTTLRSSTIDVRGTGGKGIAALTSQGGFDTNVLADGVTIVGPKDLNSTGVAADTGFATAASSSVTLDNAILRGFGKPLAAVGVGSGSARISASYSDYDYDPSKNKSVGAKAGISAANISYVGDTGFEDPADGDYVPLPGSPLVDAGDPATPQGLDMSGNPLVTDGNLDGTARRDIGAYELDGPLPTVPSAGGAGGGGGAGQVPGADRQAPVLSGFSASSARRIRLRYTLSESARVAIAIQRVVRRGGKVRYRTFGTLVRNGAEGGNRTRFSRKLGRRVLRAGRYRAIARATDAAGNRSAPRRAGFRLARR